LRYVELRSRLYRLISIMKMRESRYDTSIREFSITDEGLEVASSFESAEQILSGLARTAEGQAKS
jgi:circadian clock protein KaiC